MTDLGFVYALWVVRSRRARSSLTGPVGVRDDPNYGMRLRTLPAILNKAKARGTGNFARIAKREGKRLGLREAFCYEYLAKIMRYDLGEEELAGLKKFYEYAVKYGLAPKGVDIKFYVGR
jgi:predicted solute-binding protein